MKRKMLYVLIVLLAFTGCVSGGKAKEVTERVPVLIERTDYFADGFVDSVTTFKYVNQRLAQETVANVDGILQEKKIYRWDGPLLIRVDNLDSAERLVSYRTYGYDEAGRMISEELSEPDGTLKTRSEYQYDEKGRKSKWAVYDGSQILLAYTDYLYEGKTLVRIENKSPDGQVQEAFDIEWDGRQRSRETAYEAGRVVGTVEYEYEISRNRIVRKRANGSIARQEVFFLGADGEVVKKETQDAKGKVLYYDQRAYEIQTVKRTIYR